MITNVGLKESLMVKGQEVFIKTKCKINKIEKEIINRRNEKGIITSLDEIRFMRNIGLAKSKADLICLNDFLGDKKYEGMIELPSFGLELLDALILYKAVTKPGTFFIKIKHGNLEVIEAVDLKVRKFRNKKGEKDAEVYIDSKRILDYSKIIACYINL